MKQQSPLRKGDKHFDAIYARINKPTPAQLDAGRRASDKAVKCYCDDATQCWEPCGELGHSEEHAKVVEGGNWDAATKESNPIREVARAFVGGFGLGVAVVATIFGLVGANPLPYALGAVVCLLGYLYLDGE